jgi:hypothetical protein
MKPEYNIDAVAAILRKLYRVKREEVDGKPYRPSKRFDDKSCWLKIAETVLKLGADPVDYIEAQFRFSKSIVLANTLHGITAQKNWKRYRIVKEKYTPADEVNLPICPLPQQADLAGLIADFWHDLDYHCGSHDLTRPEVCATVIDMCFRFDPLVVMLLSPTNEFKRVFGEAAKQRLENEPHLYDAAQRMNLGEALDFIYA